MSDSSANNMNLQTDYYLKGVETAPRYFDGNNEVSFEYLSHWDHRDQWPEYMTVPYQLKPKRQVSLIERFYGIFTDTNIEEITFTERSLQSKAFAAIFKDIPNTIINILQWERVKNSLIVLMAILLGLTVGGIIGTGLIFTFGAVTGPFSIVTGTLAIAGFISSVLLFGSAGRSLGKALCKLVLKDDTIELKQLHRKHALAVSNLYDIDTRTIKNMYAYVINRSIKSQSLVGQTPFSEKLKLLAKKALKSHDQYAMICLVQYFQQELELLAIEIGISNNKTTQSPLMRDYNSVKIFLQAFRNSSLRGSEEKGMQNKGIEKHFKNAEKYEQHWECLQKSINELLTEHNNISFNQYAQQKISDGRFSSKYPGLFNLQANKQVPNQPNRSRRSVSGSNASHSLGSVDTLNTSNSPASLPAHELWKQSLTNEGYKAHRSNTDEFSYEKPNSVVKVQVKEGAGDYTKMTFDPRNNNEDETHIKEIVDAAIKYRAIHGNRISPTVISGGNQGLAVKIYVALARAGFTPSFHKEEYNEAQQAELKQHAEALKESNDGSSNIHGESFSSISSFHPS